MFFRLTQRRLFNVPLLGLLQEGKQEDGDERREEGDALQHRENIPEAKLN